MSPACIAQFLGSAISFSRSAFAPTMPGSGQHGHSWSTPCEIHNPIDKFHTSSSWSSPCRDPDRGRAASQCRAALDKVNLSRTKLSCHAAACRLQCFARSQTRGARSGNAANIDRPPMKSPRSLDGRDCALRSRSVLTIAAARRATARLRPASRRASTCIRGTRRRRHAARNLGRMRERRFRRRPARRGGRSTAASRYRQGDEIIAAVREGHAPAHSPRRSSRMPRQDVVFGAAAFQARGIPVLMHRDAAALMAARCDTCLAHAERDARRATAMTGTPRREA